MTIDYKSSIDNGDDNGSLQCIMEDRTLHKLKSSLLFARVLVIGFQDVYRDEISIIGLWGHRLIIHSSLHHVWLLLFNSLVFSYLHHIIMIFKIKIIQILAIMWEERDSETFARRYMLSFCSWISCTCAHIANKLKNNIIISVTVIENLRIHFYVPCPFIRVLEYLEFSTPSKVNVKAT